MSVSSFLFYQAYTLWELYEKVRFKNYMFVDKFCTKGLKLGDLILFVEYSKIVKIAKSYIPAKKNPNNTVIEFDRFMEGICIRHNNGILE